MNIHSKERADCAVVALSNATGKSYDECYRALADCGRKSSQRTYGYIVERAIRKLGFKCKFINCQGYVGMSVTMRKVHNYCPIGIPAVVYCTGHFVAWDGKEIVNADSTNTRKRVKAIFVIKEKV